MSRLVCQNAVNLLRFQASRIQDVKQKSTRKRDPQISSPYTVLYSNRTGCKVYLLGTNYYSQQLRQDIVRLIHDTQPDHVVIENTHVDKKTLSNITKSDKEMKEYFIKTPFRIPVWLYFSLICLSQGPTEMLFQLKRRRSVIATGVVPGSDMRDALREAKNNGYGLSVIDRPYKFNKSKLARQLSFHQKIKFCMEIYKSKEINVNDIEKLDWIEFSDVMEKNSTYRKVFIDERDILMAYKLRMIADEIKQINKAERVIVGVIGNIHIPGIKQNWKRRIPEDEIDELLRFPRRSLGGSTALAFYFFLSFLILAFGGIRPEQF